MSLLIFRSVQPLFFLPGSSHGVNNPTRRGPLVFRVLPIAGWRGPGRAALPGGVAGAAPLEPLGPGSAWAVLLRVPSSWRPRKKHPQLRGFAARARGCRFASQGRRSAYFFIASSMATATATVAPTMGLLPMPRKPIISTWAGTEEEPANCASECIRPMVSVIP